MGTSSVSSFSHAPLLQSNNEYERQLNVVHCSLVRKGGSNIAQKINFLLMLEEQRGNLTLTASGVSSNISFPSC